MFRGISNINLDAKGRMAIPARYRDAVSSVADGEMILTVDHSDRCLVLYQMEKWLDTEQALMSLPNLSPNVRKMQRLILGHASEVVMDGQGRIMVSAPLRDYARIDKKAVLIGLGEKFELWDESKWKEGRDSWVADAPVNIQMDDSLKNLSI